MGLSDQYRITPWDHIQWEQEFYFEGVKCRKLTDVHFRYEDGIGFTSEWSGLYSSIPLFVKVSKHNESTLHWYDAKVNKPEADSTWENVSRDLLVTDGTKWAMAYMYFGYDEEDEPRWKESGRDGYDLNFIPTHWAYFKGPEVK
jgi:hypothetical protein